MFFERYHAIGYEYNVDVKRGVNMLVQEDNTKVLELIIDRLRLLNVYKVILFGSHAWGLPKKDSDIDLLVVTNDDFMPQSYKEKSDLFLKVANCLEDIEREIPIDLIVYSKPMFDRFVELHGMFSRKILKDGVPLI